MATFIPGQNRFAGFEAFGQGLIQGQDKRIRRKGLLSGLTPEQQQAGQNLPLTQLTNLVSGLSQQEFLSPLQKSQLANQTILSNRRGNFLQGLGDTGFGDLSPEQLTQGSRLGLFNQPQQRQQTEFESNIATLSPEDQTRARRIKARVEPGATKSANTKISFETGFLDDNDKPETITEFVPAQFEAQAQDIGNRRGTIDSKKIFGEFTDKIAKSDGFDETTQVEQERFLEVMPDLAQAAVMKNRNPVEAIEEMFLEWETGTIRDEGGFLNLEEDVPLSTISPPPEKDEQERLIFETVAPLLDDATRQEIEGQLETLESAEIMKLLKGAFQKGRPRR